MSDIREEVRRRYAEAAVAVDSGTLEAEALATSGCCGAPAEGGCGEQAVFGPDLYRSLATDTVPAQALLASLGCGNPTAVAELHEGEVVLDLGSGGGIDVLLSAQRVGPSGRAYGLDMTDEMLALAHKNMLAAGAENVEFLKGYIEDIPLPDCSVDVIISNCVINLAADKLAVFREMYRVLREGGRIGISDVVASNDLTAEERAQRGSYVGCIAGALSFEEYEQGLREAGFQDIVITVTHDVAEDMHSAIVRGIKGS